MFRTAVRNVLAHKARLLMTMLAVLLGVAFVAGTLVFTDSMSDAFQNSSAKGFDGVDVAIRAKHSASSSDSVEDPKLTEKLRADAARTPGAAVATGVVDGFAAIADKHGDLIGAGLRSEGGNYWGGHDPRYPLRDGRAPKGADEVALDAKTADRAGYHVGDRLRLSVDGTVRTPRVSGVFTTDDGNVTAGGSLTLFDTRTAQQLFHKDGSYDEIDVQAAPGTDPDELRAALARNMPAEGTETKTGQQLADEQAKSIAASMDSMRTGLLAFAGIALFVGIFIIANAFTMLIAQRTKELALLRAVGATRRQVTRSVLFEALVVGTVAAGAGLLAGIGIGAGLRSLMTSLAATTVPQGPLVVAPGTVVLSLVVGIGVTMLAAWLPGRRAAKIPPVAAMSSVYAPPSTRSLVLRNTIGALFAAAGIALVMAGAGRSGSSGRGPVAVGAAVLVIGVFVLTPVLSRPLIAASAPLLRVFGVSGRLARLNSVRNPRRTATTAAALMIGLTLITGLTVVASSAQRSVDKMAVSSLRADYVVSMANYNTLSPTVEKTLKDTEGVTALTPLRNAPARVDGKRENLTGVDGRTMDQLTHLPLDEGAYRVRDQEVLIDRHHAEDHGWRAGDTFTVGYEDGAKQRLTVAGVYTGNEVIQGIIVDAATLRPHQSHPADRDILVKTDHGPSAAAKSRIQAALGHNPAILVQDKADVSAGIAKVFTLMLNILYALLAMAVIVAVLGVINTLAMSVFERSQEIGMLRAIGLDRSAVKRMVRLEAVVISLFGGVLGVVLGLFFGWAAGRLMAVQVPTYELVVPWTRMILFLVLSAMVGVFAALWPARRAARMNMLAAISTE